MTNTVKTERQGSGKPLVNGKLIAHGEVVVIDDRFGLKITEIVDSPS